MELVAGDGGAVPLAVLADGAQQLAHTVVLGHGLADGGVGDVDAVVLRQGLSESPRLTKYDPPRNLAGNPPARSCVICLYRTILTVHLSQTYLHLHNFC